MKFLMIVAVSAMFATNVFAQDEQVQTDPAAEPDTSTTGYPGTLPEPPDEPTAEPLAEQPPDPRIQQCRENGGGDECCAGLTACQDVQTELGQQRREQMNTTAAAYGESPEQYGRRLCRSIGGTWGDLWDGSDWKKNCECHSPREWDASHEFCLPSNAEYLERSCTESGGRWTGGYCDCGGRQRDGGRCTGLNRIELLQSQLTTAQALAEGLGRQLETANAALTAAQTAGTAQATELGALQRRYEDLERQLREATERIAYLTGRLDAEGVDVPGATETTPGATEPIPGAVAATAEVAAESTTPPVGQVPTVEEDDDSGCGGWCIAGIVAGGVAVGLGVWAIVESQTTYTLINRP